MSDDDRLRIDGRTSIPLDELTFRASRASGPGGQHVNKTSSRVTLFFHIDGSPSLDDDQKRRLHDKLSTRIRKDGVLWMSAQTSPSQHVNRRILIERFIALLAGALHEQRERRPSKPKRSTMKRRRDERERRSKVKSARRWRYDG